MVHFEKSQPAPTCLASEKSKVSGDYKCGDVLTRLANDFKGKCYICEQKNLTSINVEHFRPHEGDIDLKFDWNNLFWACVHCNGIKSNKYKDILNCTHAPDNVEIRVKLFMRSFPKEKVRVEAQDTLPATLSTAALLEAVYNGTTPLKILEAANLRDKILTEIRDFQNYICDYYKDGFDDEDKARFLSHIKRHLRKSSNFASFKRWIVKDNETFKADFEQYFD